MEFEYLQILIEKCQIFWAYKKLPPMKTAQNLYILYTYIYIRYFCHNNTHHIGE